MKVSIANASLSDLDDIKKIADSNKKEIGFIVRPIFEASINDKELLVAKIDRKIVGFLRWHHRKDGWNTLYEMAVDEEYRKKGIGRLLLDKLPTPRRGKCPIDNQSNGFHRHVGGIFVREEKGRIRKLNVYEWP